MLCTCKDLWKSISKWSWISCGAKRSISMGVRRVYDGRVLSECASRAYSAKVLADVTSQRTHSVVLIAKDLI